MAASRRTTPSHRPSKPEPSAPPPDPVIPTPKHTPDEPLTPNSPHPRGSVNIRADKVREK